MSLTNYGLIGCLDHPEKNVHSHKRHLTRVELRFKPRTTRPRLFLPPQLPWAVCTGHNLTGHPLHTGSWSLPFTESHWPVHPLLHWYPLFLLIPGSQGQAPAAAQATAGIAVSPAESENTSSVESFNPGTDADLDLLHVLHRVSANHHTKPSGG